MDELELQFQLIHDTSRWRLGWILPDAVKTVKCSLMMGENRSPKHVELNSNKKLTCIIVGYFHNSNQTVVQLRPLYIVYKLRGSKHGYKKHNTSSNADRNSFFQNNSPRPTERYGSKAHTNYWVSLFDSTHSLHTVFSSLFFLILSSNKVSMPQLAPVL
jgi:hypothetical protein